MLLCKPLLIRPCWCLIQGHALYEQTSGKVCLKVVKEGRSTRFDHIYVHLVAPHNCALAQDYLSGTHMSLVFLENFPFCWIPFSAGGALPSKGEELSKEYLGDCIFTVHCFAQTNLSQIVRVRSCVQF